MADLSDMYQTYAVGINATSSGDNEVVAADSDNDIILFSYVMSYHTADLTVHWRSGTTNKDGAGFYTTQGGGASVTHNPKGWLIVPAGSALNLNLSGSGTVGGHIRYGKRPVSR